MARAEARRHADENPPPHTDPGEILQWMVNRIADQLRYAAAKVDALPEDELEITTPFGVLPHQWVRLEERLRQELTTLCINVERVGLAERMVRIQEARALLIIRALEETLRELGIPKAKLKQVGPLFRQRLLAIEAGNGEANAINGAVVTGRAA